MFLPKWQRTGMAVALVATGMMIGTNMSTTNRAQGEVTATPEPPAFQTGGQQSVPILREISATLHQMDSRLARLEVVAQKLKPGAARSAAITRTTATAVDTQ